MITTLLIMYILIGLAVAYYEYTQSTAYLGEINQYYPLLYRVLAVGLASACVIVAWPYVLYEIFTGKH